MITAAGRRSIVCSDAQRVGTIGAQACREVERLPPAATRPVTTTAAQAHPHALPIQLHCAPARPFSSTYPAANREYGAAANRPAALHAALSVCASAHGQGQAFRAAAAVESNQQRPLAVLGVLLDRVHEQLAGCRLPCGSVVLCHAGCPPVCSPSASKSSCEDGRDHRSLGIGMVLHVASSRWRASARAVMYQKALRRSKLWDVA